MRRKKAMKIFLMGILILGVIYILSLGSISSQSTPYARIWIDKGCGSKYSDGEEIIVYFQVVSPVSTVKVSIIDYTTEGKTQYLVQNQYVYTNTQYYLQGVVKCPEGLETIEILATTVINGQTYHLKDTCSFSVASCSGYGYIYIHANVTEYTVYLDGNHILTEGVWSSGGGSSTAPYPDGKCEFTVAPGNHTLKLKKTGCESYTVYFSIGVGEKKEFYIVMECVVDNDNDGYFSKEDCNDNDSKVYPGALEVCDGKDNDCDGEVDEGFDQDGDGYTSCEGDPDDTDPKVYPGAQEVCDGKDNNDNGEVDEGFDKDGDGYTTCGGCDNGSCQGDCDDNNPSIYPGAPEVCDGKDNDCDGVIDEGFDKDNDRHTTCQGDLDDNDSTVYPGAPEVCDGKDNDCDGVIDEGFDKDGDGYTTCEEDKNDRDPEVHPDASEVCDGKDNDCDGEVDEGFDKDEDEYTSCGGDLDDNDSTVYPGAEEVCDGKDNDCDGEVDEGFDKDEDGYTTCGVCDNGSCQGDCDDNNPSIYPGAPEVCDGKDNDCDGVIDNFLENIKIFVIGPNGEPLEADILINGKYEGKTNSRGELTIFNLEACKNYIFTVEKRGYNLQQRTVSVRRDILPLEFRMERNKTWLFVGLALLGSVGVAFPIYRWKSRKKPSLPKSNYLLCPKCGNKVEEKRNSCPYCGEPLDDKTKFY
ncbi:MAG: MopE-related protein [Candidatus Methanofastidiosia archaeon]